MANLNKNPLVDEIKHELDALEVQVKTGQKELSKAYKSRNTKFAGLIRNVHDYITEIEKAGGKKMGKLGNDSKCLLDALESDFNFSYTDFTEKPQDLHSALHEFENSLKNFYDELNERSGIAKKKIEKEWKSHLKKLKTKIVEGYDSVDDREKWKNERLAEVNALKEKIDQRVHRSRDKIDKFNTELTEAYDQLNPFYSRQKHE